jgi:hypothetical protein
VAFSDTSGSIEINQILLVQTVALSYRRRPAFGLLDDRDGTITSMSSLASYSRYDSKPADDAVNFNE